jgi:uncharacterized membrane protein
MTEVSTSLMAFVGGWILSGPLIWLLIIVGIALLVRGSGRAPWAGGGRESGIDVLERRFAEGELTLEEYRKRRSVLEDKR